ncbi:MAG: alpha/beta fold hydrolase, partial [Burkholderiales bacterium]|nr:alpha/beta fold hydrolase [Burkholderiales bacterium]
MRLAWLLRLLLLGLGLAAIAWAWFWAAVGLVWLGAVGAVAIAGGHAALMALEFVWLRALNRGDPAPAPTTVELLRAWAAEVAGAIVVFGWRQPFRSRRFADTDRPPAPGRRGVVLVHGFVCNRGLWNGWWPALHAAGVPVVAVDLEPVFGSIDDYAPRIDAAVRRLEQATGRPPLLVGHSMGGLAIRAWLR